MIKTQENFNGLSLLNLYNILKAHENKIKDIATENKSCLGDTLALVSKVSGKGVEFDEDVKYGDEGFLFNSDDEAVAYYYNNKVNKFFKKPFNGKLKNGYESKGMSMSDKGVKDVAKVEKKDEEKSSEKKKEMKLKGDFGYNCNYCNGYNHLVKYCMLRKKEEKKESER